MKSVEEIMLSYSQETLAKMRDTCLELSMKAESKGALKKAAAMMKEAERIESYIK